MREASSDRLFPDDGAGTYSAEVRRIGVLVVVVVVVVLEFEFLCRWVVCWPENRGIVLLVRSHTVVEVERLLSVQRSLFCSVLFCSTILVVQYSIL